MSEHQQRSSHALDALLAVGLAAIITLSVLFVSTNRSNALGGLSVSPGAESSALYCTGFSGIKGPAPARVVFFNSTSSGRYVVINISTTTHQTVRHAFSIRPHGIFTVSAVALGPSTSLLAISAIVSGGGVTASVHGLFPGTQSQPCVSSGETEWSVSGLSSKVHWQPNIAMLNPTSTSTTLNISVWSPLGFSEPYVGLVLGPHAYVVVDLAKLIVNTTSITAQVQAVVGSVVVSALQTWNKNGIGASLVAGAVGAPTTQYFPNVPTNAQSRTELAIANTASVPASITVSVALGRYAISPFTMDLSAGTINVVNISPTSRIPNAGAASLMVTSSVPIVATVLLSQNHVMGLWPVSPAVAAPVQVLDNANETGFSAAALTNTTASPAVVTLVSYVRGRARRSIEIDIGANATASLTSIERSLMHSAVTMVTSTEPVVAAATQSSQAAGVGIVSGSGGR